MNALKPTVTTNLSSLKKLNETEDYIAFYCQLDNNGDSSAKRDDKYYQRYLQYATDEVKNRFDINRSLNAKIGEMFQKEKSKIKTAVSKASKERIQQLISQANKSFAENDAILEKEYQANLAKYQSDEKQYEAERTKHNEIAKQIQEKNKKILQEQHRVEDVYKKEKNHILGLISKTKTEIAGHKRSFRGKQEEALYLALEILEQAHESLPEPKEKPMLKIPEGPSKQNMPRKPIKITDAKARDDAWTIIEDILGRCQYR